MIRHPEFLAMDRLWAAYGLLATLLLGAVLHESSVAVEQAAGVLLFQQVDSTTFRYDVDLQNTGTTNIGTLWYSWVPGSDFLNSSPTNIISPPGWTATVTHAGATDGFAVRWVNTSGPLAPGQILSGFGFDSLNSPATLSASQVSTTFTYGGAPFSDAGFQFNIVPAADPWQNPFSRFDVDNNGTVTPHDVLLIINSLNSKGARTLGVPTLSDNLPPFLDVSGDGNLAPIDALQVINHIVTSSSSVHAASAAISFAPMVSVPEPGTGVLAMIGLASLGLRVLLIGRNKSCRL